MPPQRVLSIDIGIRNLGLCVVEYTGAAPYADWKDCRVLEWELVDLAEECARGRKVRAGAKPKNAKTLNIHQLCQALVRLLHQRAAWLDGVTDVCVEQQPLMRGANALGSARMKIIQHCILTFYDTYFLLHPACPRPDIRPASPANKLKLVLDEKQFAAPPLDQTAAHTDYKQRKAKAVQDLGTLLPWCTTTAAHRTLFADSHKRDDLADCVLQGIYELQSAVCQANAKANRPSRKRKPTDPSAHAKEIK